MGIMALLSKDLVLRSSFLFSIAIFLVVLAVIKSWLRRPEKLDLPVVEVPTPADLRQALVGGMAKYPDSPFILQAIRPIVILPVSLLNEVKNLPESKASFTKEMAIFFEEKHTGAGGISPALVNSVKIDLTRNISGALGDLQDEIVYGMSKEFGSGEDWVSVGIYEKITRLIALLSGRVFVGRPLCRDEEWIQATVMYSFYIMAARDAISRFPEVLRPIVAPFVPEIRYINKFRKRGAELLKPILEAQLAQERDAKIKIDENDDEQGNMISWILRHTPESQRSDAAVLVQNQMTLSFAAIHTTSMATTAAIYDLATYPEYIQPLRDEIQQVIDEDGEDVSKDGLSFFKKTSMPKLVKLDSFLKESQRFTPSQIPSMFRVTTSPIPLSTGITIPKGTRIGLPSWAIHHSASTPIFSPSLTSNKPVTEFDGLRFYNLRQIPGNETKHQFVTSSAESLNFGGGLHTCSGRFFASNEIKIILIELLRNWEFRFRGDTSAVGGIEKRPKNVYFDDNCQPDMAAEMEFRKRK